MELEDVDFQTRIRVELLVESAGGQTRLAHTLGFTPHSGKQKVQNWLNDGKIPLKTVLQFNKVFKKIIKRHDKTNAGSVQSA
jgi:hypothetical protein